ncbi:MAG: DUF6431 domain-containing protein [Butyrivibrio sp.]|nr:DUF6431 domain-containing protein [Butyrivibrio sp.]
MIRKNLLFSKMLNVKTSSKNLFDRYMSRFVPEKETCPICGSRGNCHIHAYYGRTITDFINGKHVRCSLCVMRVICDSCHHTHAILPDHIIPYGTYGLFFVLRVLAEHFFQFRSIESICERYGISDRQFRKWRSLFNSHKKLWLGELENLKASPRSFMKTLVSQPYNEFSSGFVSRFSFSFLQSHKNPSVSFNGTAGYCQKIFHPDYMIT